MTARFRVGRALRAPIAVAAVLAGCGGGPELSEVYFEPPETSVAYEVELVGMPDEEMVGLAEETLTLYRHRDRGAFSVPMLRRRAEDDIETVRKILHSNGYYNPTIEAAVESVEELETPPDAGIDWPSLADLAFWRDVPERPEEPEPEQFARVVITVDPGPQFTLSSHGFLFDNPEVDPLVPAPVALGSPVGGPALAVPIVGAEAAAVEILQRQGFPYSSAEDRDAVADLEQATIAVESEVFAGPLSVYGPVRIEGLEDVRERYLRTYIPWQPGELVDREELREFQSDLLGTDLFDTILVALPPDAPETEGPVALPIVVTANERPFRTVRVGGQYSTDEGPNIGVGFEHRNLWGENETVAVDGELGLEIQHLAVGYREPQFMIPGQDLIAALDLLHEEDEAFDETRATLTAGIERRLSDHWIVGYGALAEASRISEDGTDTEAYLAGIPTFVAWDSTDDLLNPTEGARARVEVTPFAGTVNDEFTAFNRIDTRSSAYWDILDDDAYVLAGRLRLGSIVADELADVPKNRRFYAGGAGSVRGYERRLVGPLEPDLDPVGGLSVIEASAEMRALIWGDIGGVLFVDAGTVGDDSVPSFEEGIRVGAGVGLRYYSPVGPIRLDVAFPVNPRSFDDAFQLYFSIGQAF